VAVASRWSLAEATVTVALNHWLFFLLAACATLLVPRLEGQLRTAGFLGINAVFVWSYWGLSATPVALGLCLVGYACARFVPERGTRGLLVCLILLTGLFAYLRGYSLSGLVSTQASPAAGAMAFAGISFLFFKIAHVVVDAASGSLGPLPFWRYMNYCLNFTTVLMGPVQRYQDFTSQWDNRAANPTGFEARVDSINRVLRGLLKAFVLATYLRPYVLQPGLPIESLSGVTLLLKAYAFYAYLYLDFSGYCDIMIGVGSLMGLRPPENFHLPFLARNVSAYWLRVHRSLTLWLTDYVFTPSYRLALSTTRLARHGFLALAVCLLLTMLVAGLWHGTTLNFVAFGAIHGLALIAARSYDLSMARVLGRDRFRRFTDSRFVTVAAVVLTYNFTALAYAFFVLDITEGARFFARLAAVAEAAWSI
jgi:D-alanyl-lipoteichoic acid acyltransferase DltB (MBOAT superfamily)